MGYQQKRSVKLYFIGGFFVLLFSLAADFSIDPQELEPSRSSVMWLHCREYAH